MWQYIIVIILIILIISAYYYTNTQAPTTAIPTVSGNASVVNVPKVSDAKASNINNVSNPNDMFRYQGKLYPINGKISGNVNVIKPTVVKATTNEVLKFDVVEVPRNGANFEIMMTGVVDRVPFYKYIDTANTKTIYNVLDAIESVPNTVAIITAPIATPSVRWRIFNWTSADPNKNVVVFPATDTTPEMLAVIPKRTNKVVPSDSFAFLGIMYKLHPTPTTSQVVKPGIMTMSGVVKSGMVVTQNISDPVVSSISWYGEVFPMQKQVELPGSTLVSTVLSIDDTSHAKTIMVGNSRLAPNTATVKFRGKLYMSGVDGKKVALTKRNGIFDDMVVVDNTTATTVDNDGNTRIVEGSESMFAPIKRWFGW